MRSISLKSKVVLGNVAVAILVLVLASSIQMHFMRQDMSRLLSDQQFALVTREAQDLDTKFETDRDVLVRLAKGFPLTELQSPSATRAYFLARPALLATFDDMLVLDTAGDLIADLPQLPHRPGLTDADRADFRKLQATLQVVVTEPAAQASRGEPGLKISLFLPADDGASAGRLSQIL